MEFYLNSPMRLHDDVDTQVDLGRSAILWLVLNENLQKVRVLVGCAASVVSHRCVCVCLCVRTL